MTDPAGNRVVFRRSVMKYFVIPSNLREESLRALFCLVLRTSFFLILNNPKVVFKFSFTLLCYCILKSFFLLNNFCYDLKAFRCGHYMEKVISLTEAQICRILITLELKVKVVRFFPQGQKNYTWHVFELWDITVNFAFQSIAGLPVALN